MPGPPSVGASPLDQMPPSPGMIAGAQGGPAGMSPTLDALGGPMQLGSDQLPPEILQGIMAIGQNIAGLFDSLAQVTPKYGSDWQSQRQMLLSTLSRILAESASPQPTPPAPTSPGAAFPGVVGGMDRGRPI